MKKILVIDTNEGFTSDLERNLIINELENIEILTKNNIDEALSNLDSLNPDEIVIPAVLISVGNWDVGIPVITYAYSNKEVLDSYNQGFKCYGIIKKSINLLDMIERGKTLDITKPSQEAQDSENQPEHADILTTSGIPQQIQQQMLERQNGNQINQQSILKKDIDENEKQQDNNSNAFSEQPAIINNTNQQYSNVHMPSNMSGGQLYINSDIQMSPDTYGDQTRQLYGYDNQSVNGSFPYANQGVIGQEYPNSVNQLEQIRNVQNYNVPMQDSNIVMGMRQQANQRLRHNVQAQQKANMSLAEQQFNTDMGYTKPPAKCITVFAAKGGVGKTTISCELATFLALTSHGKGKFKVCIIDFNIDFGDVLNTLSYDANGANMTTWAADIRERIAGGEVPEAIQYPEARILTWLQKNEKDGLYALLAPISNADSMDIDDKCIEVMLDNLIHNCGFDYVICDTGNNTRDASFIALEKADEVFLVLNQSVNTANCNNSFLATAQRVGFNMNKIKLIINKVIPAKVAGISTEELEGAFRNPYTGKPYECIVKIKNNNDIINSGNLGAPLSYNSSHEFTHSIGEIVQYLTGGQTVLQKKVKRKGFFSFLSKDRK